MTEAEARMRAEELYDNLDLGEFEERVSEAELRMWAVGKMAAALLAASRPGKGERARVCEIVKRAINRRIGPWEATDEILAALLAASRPGEDEDRCRECGRRCPNAMCARCQAASAAKGVR